ncbi:MAG: helix-turn-helix domain-containing protein [Clostridia bacterium]|nr:helix-turn-helix domain-containing protein [Clostridia bacterium]
MANRTKNYANIGNKIRELRKKENLTQKDLAKMLYKSESAIRMWELGKSEPDIETLHLLSKIFNVPVDYITGNTNSRNFFINPYTLGKKLKDLRKSKNITQEELASELGLERSSIAKYETGTTPSIDIITKIANYFKVSIDWLLEQTVEENIDTETIAGTFPYNTKKLPLLGNIACGKPIFAEEEFNGYIDVIEGIQADFCLQAKGDSMINARIYDGDIVFVKKQELVHNGEIAVVLIENEATLKRAYYYPEKQMLILKPENANYEDMIFCGEELNNITILGKAVAFQSLIR